MIRSALLLSLLLYGLNASAEVGRDSPLMWRQRSIGWYYNSLNKPDWLGEKEALDLVRRATAGWAASGIDFMYLGRTDLLPGVMDGTNVVG